MTQPRFDKQQGFVALITVLLVGAVGATITTAVILLGLTHSRTSFTTQVSIQTRVLADACAEEALQQISSSISFGGTGSLSLGQGTCTYTVTKQLGQNRTITASGVIGTVTRKVRITIDKIRPNINVTLWQEVADL